MIFRFCDMCGFSSIWIELPKDLFQCAHCLRKRKEAPKYNQPTTYGKEEEFQNSIDDLFASNQ